MAGFKGFTREPGGDARARRNANRLAVQIADLLGLGLDLNNSGVIDVDATELDHGQLMGLADDDHLQYLPNIAGTGGEGITVASRIIALKLDEPATDTVVDVADFLPFWDVSAAANKKITLANLGASLDNSIDHGALIGLSDDDHAQYLLDNASTGGIGIGVTSRVINLEINTLSAISGALTVSDLIAVYDDSAAAHVTAKAGEFATLVASLRNLDNNYSTVTHSNSTSYTTLYSFVVPANTLRTEDVLRLHLGGTYLNNSGAVRTFTIKVTFGGGTVIEIVSGATFPADADTTAWVATVTLYADGATNAQRTFLDSVWSEPQTPSVGLGGWGQRPMHAVATKASTIDTTVNQTLTFEITSSAASASLTCTKNFAFLELWAAP